LVRQPFQYCCYGNWIHHQQQQQQKPPPRSRHHRHRLRTLTFLHNDEQYVTNDEWRNTSLQALRRDYLPTLLQQAQEEDDGNNNYHQKQKKKKTIVLLLENICAPIVPTTGQTTPSRRHGRIHRCDLCKVWPGINKSLPKEKKKKKTSSRDNHHHNHPNGGGPVSSFPWHRRYNTLAPPTPISLSSCTMMIMCIPVPRNVTASPSVGGHGRATGWDDDDCQPTWYCRLRKHVQD
jgi:hypothetical protein